MSTTVYAMGQYSELVGAQFGETIDVVVSNSSTGTTGATIDGYGPEFLSDCNQATITRCVHGTGVGITKLTTTVHRETVIGVIDTTLLQSIALINVKAQYPTETITTAPRIAFTMSGGGTTVYSLHYWARPNGAVDFYWSGDVPTGATGSCVEFGLGGVSGSQYIDIGQVVASSYNQGYELDCIDHGDTVAMDRNTDTVQTIGGQTFDKLQYERMTWNGRISTDERQTILNLLWYQKQPGLFMITGDIGDRAGKQGSFYGKIRLGDMTEEPSSPVLYRVPFQFQENPA